MGDRRYVDDDRYGFYDDEPYHDDDGGYEVLGYDGVDGGFVDGHDYPAGRTGERTDYARPDAWTSSGHGIPAPARGPAPQPVQAHHEPAAPAKPAGPIFHRRRRVGDAPAVSGPVPTLVPAPTQDGMAGLSDANGASGPVSYAPAAEPTPIPDAVRDGSVDGHDDGQQDDDLLDVYAIDTDFDSDEDEDGDDAPAFNAPSAQPSVAASSPVIGDTGVGPAADGDEPDSPYGAGPESGDGSADLPGSSFAMLDDETDAVGDGDEVTDDGGNGDDEDDTADDPYPDEDMMPVGGEPVDDATWPADMDLDADLSPVRPPAPRPAAAGDSGTRPVENGVAQAPSLTDDAAAQADRSAEAGHDDAPDGPDTGLQAGERRRPRRMDLPSLSENGAGIRGMRRRRKQMDAASRTLHAVLRPQFDDNGMDSRLPGATAPDGFAADPTLDPINALNAISETIPHDAPSHDTEDMLDDDDVVLDPSTLEGGYFDDMDPGFMPDDHTDDPYDTQRDGYDDAPDGGYYDEVLDGPSRPEPPYGNGRQGRDDQPGDEQYDPSIIDELDETEPGQGPHDDEPEPEEKTGGMRKKPRTAARMTPEDDGNGKDKDGKRTNADGGRRHVRMPGIALLAWIAHLASRLTAKAGRTAAKGAVGAAKAGIKAEATKEAGKAAAAKAGAEAGAKGVRALGSALGRAASQRTGDATTDAMNHPLKAARTALRAMSKARRVATYGIAAAGVLGLAWAGANIPYMNPTGSNDKAVDEGSVRIAKSSYEDGTAHITLTNDSDMIANISGTADVYTWSPFTHGVTGVIAPKKAASCTIPDASIDPGATAELTAKCDGTATGAWPRVKVNIEY